VTLIAAAARAPIKDVTIDLDAAPQRANIVRDGREVVTPIANPERAKSVLENFIPIARLSEPRSVSQSIAPGTIVSRGTAIDVEFLAREQVKIGIFEGVHVDLRDVLVTAPRVDDLLKDPEITAALAKPDLTDNEKQNLRTKLTAANVAVDDATPDKSLGAAITGLRAAQAFR